MTSSLGCKTKTNRESAQTAQFILGGILCQLYCQNPMIYEKIMEEQLRYGDAHTATRIRLLRSLAGGTVEIFILTQMFGISNLGVGPAVHANSLRVFTIERIGFKKKYRVGFDGTWKTVFTSLIASATILDTHLP